MHPIAVTIAFLFLSVSLLDGKAQAPSSDQEKVRIPDVPSFLITYQGESLKCYPTTYNDSAFYERRIEYRCLKKDIPFTYSDTSGMSSDGEATGQDETRRLLNEVKNKKSVGNIYTVQIPERLAYTPWKAKAYALRQLKNGFFYKYLGWALPAKLYMSIRPQLSNTSNDRKVTLRDGGSRGGFFYYYQFDSGLELTLQHEAKINWSDISSFVNVSNNSESTRRLQYVSLRKENRSLLLGKYWSPYYDIAGTTDKFMAYGGDSSGAFNAGGDGGASGTGRSNRSLQLSFDELGGFSTRLQLQPLHHPNEGVDSDYSYGLAGNIVYKGWGNTRIGAAVAFGKFHQITEEMRAIGLGGNDLSTIAGISYKWGDLMANAVISYGRNHMSDDQGIYFNSIGAELYLRYDFSKSIRFAFGGNWLTPRDDDYTGLYTMKRSIFSLQYTFGKKSFDDLVYIEVSVPRGELANGDTMSTSVAVGLRYRFDIW